MYSQNHNGQYLKSFNIVVFSATNKVSSESLSAIIAKLFRIIGTIIFYYYYFFFVEKPAKPTGPLLKLKRNNQGTSKTTNWAMSEGKSPSHSLVSVKHLAFLANASATTLQAR